jgi:hypothetical protein
MSLASWIRGITDGLAGEVRNELVAAEVKSAIKTSIKTLLGANKSEGVINAEIEQERRRVRSKEFSSEALGLVEQINEQSLLNFWHQFLNDSQSHPGRDTRIISEALGGQWYAYKNGIRERVRTEHLKDGKVVKVTYEPDPKERTDDAWDSVKLYQTWITSLLKLNNQDELYRILTIYCEALGKTRTAQLLTVVKKAAEKFEELGPAALDASHNILKNTVHPAVQRGNTWLDEQYKKRGQTPKPRKR